MNPNPEELVCSLCGFREAGDCTNPLRPPCYCHGRRSWISPTEFQRRKRILRGSGPAPSSYTRCYDPYCFARRNPSTGRWDRLGTHYHPNTPQGSADASR